MALPGVRKPRRILTGLKSRCKAGVLMRRGGGGMALELMGDYKLCTLSKLATQENPSHRYIAISASRVLMIAGASCLTKYSTKELLLHDLVAPRISPEVAAIFARFVSRSGSGYLTGHQT
ncbi:hypothetical protein Pst134EB_012970 [Puccinia striiformis f. sp. tritici]|nr:hypothetical protein Pst134EB_012970 [Puccinia striiformis f. sp. tritici]